MLRSVWYSRSNKLFITDPESVQYLLPYGINIRVEDPLIFYPERRAGIFFHLTLIITLLALGLWGYWQASNANLSPLFFLYLLPTTLGAIFLPVLGYRLYSLLNAYYYLRRDGIRLHWGLRDEQIPMDIIEWVHPADDLEPSVPLPYWRFPGGILGTRIMPGGGQVEFFASSSRNMLVIATPNTAYVISPADPDEFRNKYQSIIELGTVTPVDPRSVYPNQLISQVWSSVVARFLLLVGFLLNIVLLIIVVLSFQNREFISLGFLPTGTPGELVPSVRLMLLPVLCVFFSLINFFLGLFYFRLVNYQYLAYVIWTFGIITPILFLIATWMIIST